MEFKWSVNKVTVAQDNLITQVELTVTATDGDNTASAAYTRDLVRGDSFSPYDQLTEQQVLDWCFEPIVTTHEDRTETFLMQDSGETQVAGQIARQLAKKQTEPALPWAQIQA